MLKHTEQSALLVFAEDDGFVVKSLMDCLAFCFQGADDLMEGVDLANPNARCYLKCRADLQPGSLQEGNHFMPLWHKSQLGDATFVFYQRAVEAEIAAKKAHVCERLVNISEMDEEDEDWGSALLSSLLVEEKQLDVEEALYKRLFATGFVPCNVPGDGNCLVWSFIAHELGPSCIVEKPEFKVQQCKMLRQDKCQFHRFSFTANHVYSFSIIFYYYPIFISIFRIYPYISVYSPLFPYSFILFYTFFLFYAFLGSFHLSKVAIPIDCIHFLEGKGFMDVYGDINGHG